MRTLSKRQRKGLRTAKRCVVCNYTYPPDVDRTGLFVYPDGCTAHDACAMGEDGGDIYHWHTVEARDEEEFRRVRRESA